MRECDPVIEPRKPCREVIYQRMVIKQIEQQSDAFSEQEKACRKHKDLVEPNAVEMADDSQASDHLAKQTTEMFSCVTASKCDKVLSSLLSNYATCRLTQRWLARISC